MTTKSTASAALAQLEEWWRQGLRVSAIPHFGKLQLRVERNDGVVWTGRGRDLSEAASDLLKRRAAELARIRAEEDEADRAFEEHLRDRLVEDTEPLLSAERDVREADCA